MSNSPLAEKALIAPLWPEAPDPFLYFDSWDIGDLPAENRRRMKAALLKVHSDWLEPELKPFDPIYADDHDVWLRRAFDAIAGELFAGGLLDEAKLATVVTMVHDVACSGQWNTVAKGLAQRTEKTPKQFGNYWVYDAPPRVFIAVLAGRIYHWRAQILERPSTPAAKSCIIPSETTATSPKELLEAFMNTHYATAPVSKETFALDMGIERSVFFRLQAGKPVSKETYVKVSDFTSIPIAKLNAAETK